MRGTNVGVPAALLSILTWALRAPRAVVLAATSIVQVAPGATNVPMQVLAKIWKSAAFVPAVAIAVTPSGAVPVALVTVTRWKELRTLIRSLPKSNDVGDTVAVVSAEPLTPVPLTAMFIGE